MFNTKQILDALLESNRQRAELIEEVRTGNRIQSHILELLQRQTNRVTGGVITRIPTGEAISMSSPTFPVLGPGVTAKFQVAWTANGAADPNTVAADTAWSSSDPANFPAVIDPTDPTGTTADVTIPDGETTTEEVTLTVVYTNADGTTATASAVFDLVGGTVQPVDVTAGTITRIA